MWMDDLCSEDGRRVYDKERLLCSVIVAKKIVLFVIQLSVWTNEPHTNRRIWSPLIVSDWSEGCQIVSVLAFWPVLQSWNEGMWNDMRWL